MDEGPGRRRPAAGRPQRAALVLAALALAVLVGLAVLQWLEQAA